MALFICLLAGAAFFAVRLHRAEEAPAIAIDYGYGTFGLGLSFPALHIEFDQVRIFNRTDWVDATVSMRNTADIFLFEDATAHIRGRGNSSWGLPKRPYRLRFTEARTLMCAGHEARNWTLIANHSDKSLLRNFSAYYLAGLLDGMQGAPYARFVDLYLNGLYQGVYMVSWQMEVLDGRVEIVGSYDPALSEYFLQMDQRQVYYGAVRGLDFVTVERMHYQIRYPRQDVRTTEHAAYVQQFLARVNSMISTQDENVFNYICKASFVDFYLVQELFKNQDVGFSSIFMTIQGQGENRRIVMGPVWDFDIAAGNAYYQGWQAYHGGYSPRGVWAASVNAWFRRLMRMESFREAVAERWSEIRHREVAQMLERIDFIATTYRRMFERNFARWPIMGRYVWPNPRNIVAINTFRGQVDFLIHFLEERAIFLDEFLNR
ncbi:MAG: CotH kinase family protein [Defluviitaleaceae bacterium]|nr:CotH kinase family protein [Defluviitaleaceae bacterium]MCL2275614.1 CotH kinase family protein [Defluviitaleaceae bacterium]